MSEDGLNQERRRLLGAAVTTIAAAELALIGPAEGLAQKPSSKGRRGTNTFGSLKHIDAGVPSIGYAEAGPDDGRPAILLHGWPSSPVLIGERGPPTSSPRSGPNAARRSSP